MNSIMTLFLSGGPLMWPILACSLAFGTFFLERLVAMRRAAVFPSALRAKLLAAVREGGAAAALRACEGETAPYAVMARACLERADAGGFEMNAGLEEGGARVLGDLRRGARPLAIVGDIAPLLGLMGTVTGMIKAFDVVAKAGALGRTELLAAGISEALLTTAFGLLVAVPSILSYHYFRSRADSLAREMEDACLELIRSVREREAAE
ncbi:MAG: MotA/TolQ/ExbB proton channel family protein [Kiritimatiellia bacterium]|jgi:biopolymer transport protein ExbB